MPLREGGLPHLGVVGASNLLGSRDTLEWKQVPDKVLQCSIARRLFGPRTSRNRMQATETPNGRGLLPNSIRRIANLCTPDRGGYVPAPPAVFKMPQNVVPEQVAFGKQRRFENDQVPA